VLEVNNLSVSFEENFVFSNLDMHVNDGELYGLIGPNGAGKTTLLKCISGVLNPQNGSVILKDRNIDSMSRKEIAKKIGVVPQKVKINFNFKVEEIIELGRLPHKGYFRISSHSLDRDKVEEAMRATKTHKFKERDATTLSGGELQRVMIARALAQDPDLLLLDEPTSHLDINHQIKIMDLVKTISEEKSVVAVFHDLNLASHYCDRVALLGNGRILNSGKPEEVIKSSTIEQVYGARVTVDKHPITGKVHVTPIHFPNQNLNEKTDKLRIHVVCGGGTGTDIMRELVNEGYNVTAGVLNVLDSDKKAAESMGIPHIQESPFSDITEASMRENIRLIKSADLIILSEVPFGEGNIRNLEAVAWALNNDKKVYMIDDLEDRDFTDDKAFDLLEDTKEDNLRLFKDTSTLLDSVLENTGD